MAQKANRLETGTKAPWPWRTAERQTLYMPRLHLLSAIRVRAFQMARSGEFPDCRSIEVVLEKTEGERARLALRQPTIRAHLEQLCKISCTVAGTPAGVAENCPDTDQD
jgi:hypothetical protein